jgi:hypothetical protein
MSLVSQTAKNTLKALTSELPPITDMARPRGSAFAELLPIRSVFSFFGKKSQMGAIAHRGPRDVAIVGVSSKPRICSCMDPREEFPVARTRSKNGEPLCSQNIVKSPGMMIGEL